MHTVHDPYQCTLFMTYINAHCSWPIPMHTVRDPCQCTLFMTVINAYCSWLISMHIVHDPYRGIMKQKRWNKVEGNLNKTQFPAAGAAWKATFVLLIGFKMGLLTLSCLLVTRYLTFCLLQFSSFQFNSAQFCSIQFSPVQKNFNYPTRDNFVVVMAGS